MSRPGVLRHYARQARARPALLLRHAPRLWSPRVLFTDPHHDTGRAVLVAGSARSGTTWLAATLASGHAFRLVFEPLRRDGTRAARAVPRSYFVPPGDDDPVVAALLARILDGRLRALWSDNHNRCRRAEGRVVKEVRANNLLPFVARHFPGVPIVYLLRHPLAAAWSAAELGMTSELGDLVGQPRLLAALTPGERARAARWAEGDPVERFVLRWCLENALPVRLLGAGQAHVVFYEDLVASPAEVVAGAGAHCARSAGVPGPWRGWTPDPEVLRRPSRTSWRAGPAAAAGPVGGVAGWQAALDPAVVARSLDLVAAFGLGHLYGADPRPLVAAGEVLDGGA